MSGNPNSIWKAHSDLFHRLYLQEDHPLKDVKLIAERDHNFPKTPLVFSLVTPGLMFPLHGAYFYLFPGYRPTRPSCAMS